MKNKQFTGVTFSSTNSNSFFVTEIKGVHENIFGNAYVLKEDFKNNEELTQEEILNDKEVVEYLKESPRILAFFKSNKTIINVGDDIEVSEDKKKDLEKNIEEIENEEIRNEAKSLFTKIRDKGGRILVKIFFALGLLVVTHATPRPVMNIEELDFTPSMPINFDVTNVYDQNIIQTGATQSMNFYYTGSTQSNA